MESGEASQLWEHPRGALNLVRTCSDKILVVLAAIIEKDDKTPLASVGVVSMRNES